MTRHARTALVLATAAVLAAGCGGDGSLSKSDYVEKNNAIQTEAMESISSLGTASSDPAKAAAQLEQAKEGVDEAVKDLTALDPPSDWEDEHADLVGALEDMGTEIDSMQTAATDEDVEALTASVSKLNEIQGRASKAINAMNADR